MYLYKTNKNNKKLALDSCNQWQNIMGILKVCLKNPLSLYTMLQIHNIACRKFCSLFLNNVKRGKWEETRSCPKSCFSHNFCHWLSEKIWKISSVVFYCWSFWISLKACNYPLRYYDTSFGNFWSPNKQPKHLDKWGKICIFQIFFR